MQNSILADFITERLDLSGELALWILTALVFSNGIIASYEWVEDQNYSWIIFLSISVVGTIVSRIYFGFKSKLPKFHTKKIKQVKSIIMMTAFLLAFGQASSIGLFFMKVLQNSSMLILLPNISMQEILQYYTLKF